MSIVVNCVIDLTEEELMYILLARAGAASDASAPTGLEGLGNLGQKPIDREQQAEIERKATAIPEERIEAAASSCIPAALAEPPPLPPKPTRRAKANGTAAVAQEAGGTSGVNAPAGQQAMQGVNSTPLAPPPSPPPEPLDEPAMRSLLSKVGAVHPLKVKAITNILENCGGARRLSECDPSTWPAIAEAALVALKEHSA